MSLGNSPSITFLSSYFNLGTWVQVIGVQPTTQPHFQDMFGSKQTKLGHISLALCLFWTSKQTEKDWSKLGHISLALWKFWTVEVWQEFTKKDYDELDMGLESFARMRHSLTTRRLQGAGLGEEHWMAGCLWLQPRHLPRWPRIRCPRCQRCSYEANGGRRYGHGFYCQLVLYLSLFSCEYCWEARNGPNWKGAQVQPQNWRKIAVDLMRR